MPKIGDMTGKAALVTGAASGVGRSTAIALAGAGADVLLVDRDRDGLAETAAEIAPSGRRVQAHPADLSRREDCAAAVEAAVASFGRLDALCNIAGVFLPAHAESMPTEQWDLTVAVNLSAPFHLIQAAIPHLRETRGAVVNVSSCAGIRAQAYSAAYCATKAGLNHMTRALAIEYVHSGIRFNAVAPGGMVTSMTRNLQFPPDIDRALFGRVSPMRGLVEVEEVAEMVAFLASDAARSYHGACISIDNGITAD